MGQLGAHPKIVPVYEMGEHDGQQYVIMELMEHGDVADALDSSSGNGLPVERALTIGKAVCHGLAYAHSKSVIHRDIKPSSIWLTSG